MSIRPILIEPSRAPGVLRHLTSTLEHPLMWRRADPAGGVLAWVPSRLIPSRVGQLADAVVEDALALADTPEIEAQGREAAPHERLVERLHDVIVHRAARLRVRVEDQGDGRAGAGPWLETTFKTAFRPWKNDFGH